MLENVLLEVLVIIYITTNEKLRRNAEANYLSYFLLINAILTGFCPYFFK